MSDITAKSSARALLRHWVARFGVPDSIVSDRGRQFTSELWLELTQALGISRKLTTSYHPQSNGMIERQHRTLKDRLIARAHHAGGGWMEHLPFVLLGLRASVREDAGCSPADLLYGSPLRLPGPLLDSGGLVSSSPDPSSFVAHLRGVMDSARPIPVIHHGVRSSSVDPALSAVSHVFLRIDAVKRPLVAPYEGPFQVLSRTPKTFVLLRRGKPVTVTVDRLKPAFFLPESAPLSPSSPRPVSSPADPVVASLPPQPPPLAPAPVSSPSPALDPQDWPLPTRYGRRPRPPTRLNL